MLIHKLAFWLGLAVVLGYVISIQPTGFQRGYMEDFGTFEMSRQIMADQYREKGRPQFSTSHYFYPVKTPTAYMPQSIEQTGIGALVWNWDRDFPYFWVYFIVSLLTTYVGTGFILKKMGLSSFSAWTLSTLVSVFHIPRHFVTWYHSEYMYQHWIFLGFFLDAWIWQRLYREKRWSYRLEAWRLFFLTATFGTAGYFWGAATVEWLVVRCCMVALAWMRGRHKIKTQIEDSFITKRFPYIQTGLILSTIWSLVALIWFVPLLLEAQKLGSVPQGLGFHAPFFMVFRPLWWDGFLRWIETFIPALQGLWLPFQFPETKVTIGWFFWIPAVLGLRVLRKRNGSIGWGPVAPFIVLLFIALWYLGIKPHLVQIALQALIPFMKFFRVASRWGLFLPQIVVIIIALSWPELNRWARSQMKQKRFKLLFGLFIAMSLFEMSWVNTPVAMMRPFPNTMTKFLEDLKNAPGTAVLDMPFCLIGGNSTCSHQCPAYPESTIGANLRQWHDKDVYGIYMSRLVDSQCDYYSQEPYLSWINAWWAHRCFSPEEWDALCQHLDEHSELAAILVYPEMWKAMLTSECQLEFEKHFGKPLAQAEFYTDGQTTGKPQELKRVLRYQPKCRR